MKISKCLTYTDWPRIETMLKQKMSKQNIANTLRVHVSNIYREIKRGEYVQLNRIIQQKFDIVLILHKSTLILQKSGMDADLKIGKDYELVIFLKI